MLRTLAMEVMIGAVAATSAFADLPGKWTHDSFSNADGARGYYLYVPKNGAGHAKLPLLVMLHGCLQEADSFALDTGMNDVAEKYGFAVLYPEQSYADNVWKCWNWYRPENQARSGAESGILVDMIRKVAGNLNADLDRIYVAGISAGGAMAANLAACHADLFSGVAIHSGLEFKAATTEVEAHQVMSTGSTRDLKQTAADAVQCSGKNAKLLAGIVIYGSGDSVVNPVNSTRALMQLAAINDLLDDGAANESQGLTPIAKRRDQVPGGRSYTTEFYGGGGSVHLEKVEVEGMGHAWSGAVRSGTYADTSGPNAAEMIWIFLSNYSVKRGGP